MLRAPGSRLRALGSGLWAIDRPLLILAYFCVTDSTTGLSVVTVHRRPRTRWVHHWIVGEWIYHMYNVYRYVWRSQPLSHEITTQSSPVVVSMSDYWLSHLPCCVVYGCVRGCGSAKRGEERRPRGGVSKAQHEVQRVQRVYKSRTLPLTFTLELICDMGGVHCGLSPRYCHVSGTDHTSHLPNHTQAITRGVQSLAATCRAPYTVYGSSALTGALTQGGWDGAGVQLAIEAFTRGNSRECSTSDLSEGEERAHGRLGGGGRHKRSCSLCRPAARARRWPRLWWRRRSNPATAPRLRSSAP